MSKIRNIWKEVSSNQPAERSEITPLKILEEQANAINDDADRTNIVGMTMTFTISQQDTIKETKHILYLFPKNGNDYNYRFIEIKQNIDSVYPIKVSAFQNGNTDFGTCKNEDEFYETLKRIFTDRRKEIVFDQLKNIGNSIEEWKKER